MSANRKQLLMIWTVAALLACAGLVLAEEELDQPVEPIEEFVFATCPGSPRLPIELRSRDGELLGRLEFARPVLQLVHADGQITEVWDFGAVDAKSEVFAGSLTLGGNAPVFRAYIFAQSVTTLVSATQSRVLSVDLDSHSAKWRRMSAEDFKARVQLAQNQLCAAAP